MNRLLSNDQSLETVGVSLVNHGPLARLGCAPRSTRGEFGVPSFRERQITLGGRRYFRRSCPLFRAFLTLVDERFGPRDCDLGGEFCTGQGDVKPRQLNFLGVL